MAESTLSLGNLDFQQEIGFFLGFGRGTAVGDPAWTTEQQLVITNMCRSGYRQFLNPPVLEGHSVAYDWSFSKPVATLALASAAQTIVLPDDFGGFEGQVTVLTTGSTSQPWTIEWRNEDVLRRMYAGNPSVSGPPLYAAEQPIKGTSAAAGQRFQMFVYPAADQAYNLQVQYYVNPDALSSAYPYAYGGMQHTETLLASCLAAAELYLDDARGPRWQYFLERLAASIGADRRNKPLKLGPNLDRSDNVRWGRSEQHYCAPAATYNGGGFS